MLLEAQAVYWARARRVGERNWEEGLGGWLLVGSVRGIFLFCSRRNLRFDQGDEPVDGLLGEYASFKGLWLLSIK